MFAYFILEIAWVAACVAVHEGIARSLAGGAVRFGGRKLALGGVLVLLVGSGFWYWEAWGRHRAADLIPDPTQFSRRELTPDELAAVPEPERSATSTKWAQMTFVNGGKLLNVVTEDGHSRLYEPTPADVQARDQLKEQHCDLQGSRRIFLMGEGEARREMWRWLLSLLAVIWTGAWAGRKRRLENAVARDQSE